MWIHWNNAYVGLWLTLKYEPPEGSRGCWNSYHIRAGYDSWDGMYLYLRLPYIWLITHWTGPEALADWGLGTAEWKNNRRLRDLWAVREGQERESRVRRL